MCQFIGNRSVLCDIFDVHSAASVCYILKSTNLLSPPLPSPLSQPINLNNQLIGGFEEGRAQPPHTN